MDYGTLTYTDEEGAVRTVPLRHGGTTLGSAKDNNIVLKGPGIAPNHALIVCTATICWITDLDSEHGTLLGGNKLTPRQRQPLSDGDKIRIGTVEIAFARSTVQAPAAPPPEVLGEVVPSARQSRWRGVGQPPAIPRGGRRFGYPVSSYLQYLPPHFQESGLLGRFLLIFESILDPIERSIGQIHHYFDPLLTPEPLLPWLAKWVDLALNEKWPLERRRALVLAAAELYRWRGTRRGLREYIRIYVGVEPTIIESWQEAPGDNAIPLPSHAFRVIISTLNPNQIDRRLVEEIIEVEKPAHTAYILEIRKAQAEAASSA